jgi:hypothetical protein
MVKKAYLTIFAITIGSMVAVGYSEMSEPRALCNGHQYLLHHVANGASPYIELSADGIGGRFLLDYGTTQSVVSDSALQNFERARKDTTLGLSGLQSADLAVRHLDMPLQPAGTQIGTIGTDFLSTLSVQITGNRAYLSEKPCASEAVRLSGFVAVAQKGFFSSDLSMIDRSHPNVPIVFLRLAGVRTFAQIDTGYEDLIYPHSLDINEAFYKQLIADGIDLDHLGEIRVFTCEGAETRPVYSVRNRSLVIETERAAPILTMNTFHLIVKPANGCGGIAGMGSPAAQLGASFLQLFKTVIFDPQSGTVWFKV